MKHTLIPLHDPGLVRAADLIGQLADVNYLRKIPPLFAEFNEIGTNKKLGYRNPANQRVFRRALGCFPPTSPATRLGFL